jgi:type IV pilus assembly protein PilO
MALQDSLNQLRGLEFGDLDVNNIGGWPSPLKAIILMLLIIVVVGAGYFFLLTEKRTALDAARKQESTLKSEYEAKAFQAANLPQYRQQKEEMEVSFGTMLRQLPSDTEVPGLIEDITLAALDHGLQIESIDLQPEHKAEFYVELPMTIGVSGEYHDVGSFVSAVANLSRIVTLHDFTIKPSSGGKQNLKMSIVAKTYRYLGQEDKK